VLKFSLLESSVYWRTQSIEILSAVVAIKSFFFVTDLTAAKSVACAINMITIVIVNSRGHQLHKRVTIINYNCSDHKWHL
jgi:hypothetical protein